MLGLIESTNLLDKGHHVYMDNYYSRPELFSELYFRQTYACGTVRQNHKGLPNAVKKAKLEPLQSFFLRNGPLLCLKFRFPYSSFGPVHLPHCLNLYFFYRFPCSFFRPVHLPHCLNLYFFYRFPYSSFGPVRLPHCLNLYFFVLLTLHHCCQLFYFLISYLLFSKYWNHLDHYYLNVHPTSYHLNRYHLRNVHPNCLDWCSAEAEVQHISFSATADPLFAVVYFDQPARLDIFSLLLFHQLLHRRFCRLLSPL